MLTLKCRASLCIDWSSGSSTRIAKRSASTGTRSSAATALHHISSRRWPLSGAASHRTPPMAKPKMRQFMRQRKHLADFVSAPLMNISGARLSASANTAELLRIESRGCCSTQHRSPSPTLRSCRLGRSNNRSALFRQVRQDALAPTSKPSSRAMRDATSSGAVAKVGAADKGRLRQADRQRKVAIPALPFLTGIEHVKQVADLLAERRALHGCGNPESAGALQAVSAKTGSRWAHARRAQRRSNCLSVGCVLPDFRIRQVRGKRPSNCPTSSIPARSRAQRKSSGRMNARVT